MSGDRIPNGGPPTPKSNPEKFDLAREPGRFGKAAGVVVGILLLSVLICVVIRLNVWLLGL